MTPFRTETGKNGAVNRKAVPRSPEDLKKIRDLVTAAVGIDMNRGDVLTVENIAFEAPADAVDVPESFFTEWKPMMRPALRYVAFLLLFLMAYFLFFRPVSKRLMVSVEQSLNAPQDREIPQGAGAPALSLATPKTVKELEAALGATSSLSSGDINKSDILKQRIADFVQKIPKKVRNSCARG
jgi:flagellar M-ring protein FliF